MNPPVKSVRTRGSVRATLVVMLAAMLAAGGAIAADEPLIKVKVAGELPLPAGAPLGVIATDPVLQQVLSQDFQVAGRLAGAGASSITTVTVTLSQRRLAPGMSLNDVAPGDHDAVAILEAMGVKPPPPPAAAPAPPPGQEDAQTAAEGNPSVSNDVRSYEQQSHGVEPQPLGAPMAAPVNPWPMMPWPVPPATAQERSALPSYMPAPNYQPGRAFDQAGGADASSDTIFIARVTAGRGAGSLTVLAVAHPGFDKHQVRKLIAEEIANALLH